MTLTSAAAIPNPPATVCRSDWANSAVNSNMNSNPGNGTATTGAINTREPDKYSATLTFSLQTEGGDKAIGIPSLSISVARNGDRGAHRQLIYAGYAFLTEANGSFFTNINTQ